MFDKVIVDDLIDNQITQQGVLGVYSGTCPFCTGFKPQMTMVYVSFLSSGAKRTYMLECNRCLSRCRIEYVRQSMFEMLKSIRFVNLSTRE